jgi:hypothetical protein
MTNNAENISTPAPDTTQGFFYERIAKSHDSLPSFGFRWGWAGMEPAHLKPHERLG